LLRIRKSRSGATPWRLPNGSVVPPHSVADHVNLDGKPVYYPGTYASDESQGNLRFGKYPPHDDQYWPTFTAHAYVQISGDQSSASRAVDTPSGPMPRVRACTLAHEALPTDAETGLCIASDEPDEHIVDWGYNDTVYKSGLLLFPSLLRYESAKKLAQLYWWSGSHSTAAEYRAQAERISRSVSTVFTRREADGSVWLRSATGLGSQPDVWGTAYAVYEGVVDAGLAEALGRALRNAYRAGTTTRDGHVRHIPTDFGHWEKAAAKGTYQNGAYWGHPVGWYVYALSLVDADAARELFGEYLRELSACWGQGFAACAWECMNKEIGHYQNPGYMASVALPYVCLKQREMV
jgi:hypothetical protein